MKKLKKQWLRELDARAPELSPEVMDAPMPAVRASREPFFIRFRKPLAMALCMLLVCVSVIFILPDGAGDDGSLVMLEINPRVVFLADAEGRVSDVISMNSDADVILSSDERRAQLIGAPLDEAIVIFFDYSARAGYVSLDAPDAIRVSGSGEGAQALVGRSVDALRTYFSENEIPSLVDYRLVGVSELCEGLGVEVKQSIDELCSALGDMSKLFCEREMVGKSESEIADRYENGVLEILKEQISADLDEYILDTGRLSEINLSIISELYVDYFTARSLLESGIVELPESAVPLMNEMEAALASYYEKYGVVIDSSEALAVASLGVVNLLGEFLAAWAENMLEAINVLPSAIGIDATVVELISSAPDTADEYAASVKSSADITFNNFTVSGDCLY